MQYNYDHQETDDYNGKTDYYIKAINDILDDHTPDYYTGVNYDGANICTTGLDGS